MNIKDLVIPTEVRSDSDGKWRNLLFDSAIAEFFEYFGSTARIRDRSPAIHLEKIG